MGFIAVGCRELSPAVLDPLVEHIRDPAVDHTNSGVGQLLPLRDSSDYQLVALRVLRHVANRDRWQRDVADERIGFERREHRFVALIRSDLPFCGRHLTADRLTGEAEFEPGLVPAPEQSE